MKKNEIFGWPFLPSNNLSTIKIHMFRLVRKKMFIKEYSFALSQYLD